ncbi:MAG: G5 domain-containing protein, partial [Mogibacterium sp.]|nr:G5 domain-containing protein [Mogibacterium sp.]
MWAGHIGTLTPYAISYEDQEICRVRNKETASRVLNNVFEDMTQDDTNIAAISSDFHIKKGGTGEIVSEEEAVDAVITSAEDSGATIRIASSKTSTEAFTPTPDYKENGQMFAGDAEVISEGSDGEKEVGVTYTTVNGTVENKDKTDIEVLDEGVPAVIEKGTLGLPKGET